MVQAVETFRLSSVNGILYEVPVLNSSASGVCQMRNRKFLDRIQKYISPVICYNNHFHTSQNTCLFPGKCPLHPL